MSLISDKIRLKNQILDYSSSINDPAKLIMLNALLVEVKSVMSAEHLLAMENRFNVVKLEQAQVYDIKPATADAGGTCEGPWCSRSDESGDGPINVESEFLPYGGLVSAETPPELNLSAGGSGYGNGAGSGTGAGNDSQHWSLQYGFMPTSNTLVEELASFADLHEVG